MDNEFEKAKLSFIDGMTRYLEYMKPLLTLGHSMKILGIFEALGHWGDDNEALYSADLWDLALNSFLAEMKEAKNKDDVAQAVQNHRDFLKMLF